MLWIPWAYCGDRWGGVQTSSSCWQRCIDGYRQVERTAAADTAVSTGGLCRPGCRLPKKEALELAVPGVSQRVTFVQVPQVDIRPLTSGAGWLRAGLSSGWCPGCGALHPGTRALRNCIATDSLKRSLEINIIYSPTRGATSDDDASRVGPRSTTSQAE